MFVPFQYNAETVRVQDGTEFTARVTHTATAAAVRCRLVS